MDVVGSPWDFVGKQLSFTPAKKALELMTHDNRFHDYCASLEPPLNVVGEEGENLLLVRMPHHSQNALQRHPNIRGVGRDP